MYERRDCKIEDIKYIKGVGPERVKLLNKLDIYTVKDLVEYFPRDYEDRGNITKISNVKLEENILIEATTRTAVIEQRTRSITICKLVVEDNTGEVEIIWFNQPYIRGLIQKGEKYKFFGKIQMKSGKLVMNAPLFDKVGENKNTGGIMPIYPLTYKLQQSALRNIIKNAVNIYNEKEMFEETLPNYIRDKYSLYSIKQAINAIHMPKNETDFKKARERIAFEELFIMQLKLLALKGEYKENIGIKFSNSAKCDHIIDALPFILTNAQKNVISEIEADMESNKNMNRLVQGDVGSGKTIVAILAAYKAVKSGYQVAMMAPTAILAAQHLENFKNILEKYDIKCELLVSGITAKNKREILEKLEKGEIDILIGTHAVIEENISFKNLGLAITDEQHRFGVKQRGILTEKGENVDILVMTATPIPRTLALILFGDLDISIIDELPPNRQKIDTVAITKGLEDRLNIFLEKQLQEGRQAYIICPLVEDKEDSELLSVEEVIDKYKNKILPEYNIKELHGKMRPKEKEEIMVEFKEGKIDVLISTTVIEVGVDVPNASIIVVENAERFGLAQLHQLRGRVGRGKYKSFCILKYKGRSENIRERMKIMADTNDGFKIAEKDLELRGTGDFFGTKQHGIPDFKVANLFEDMQLLKTVQKEASEIIAEDPKLELEKNLILNNIIQEKVII